MKLLYAPWRSNYALKGDRPMKSCAFCEQIASQEDEKHFIIKRFSHCFVNLNLFPYNAGHIMVIPYQHQASLPALSQETRAELIEVVSVSIDLLTTALQAEGFNAGFNLGGKAAGGSIPKHLHIHILPRWLGDTNFLITLADVKPISFDLNKTYQTLRSAFKNVTI